MTETLSDKPWSFTGFGTIRCGRHTVLHLDINLSDEVSREEYERIGRLAAAAPLLLEWMRSILRLDTLDAAKFIASQAIKRIDNAQDKT
jgi:hypothetical protein